jgi:hypothetical protein
MRPGIRTRIAERNARDHFLCFGDLFPKDMDDIEHFSARSALIQELHIINAGPWAYRVNVLRKNE